MTASETITKGGSWLIEDAAADGILTRERLTDEQRLIGQTAEAFVESSNLEVATVDKAALMTSVRRGETTMLARYANLRGTPYPRPKHPSFFLTTRATRPDITVVHKTFRLLCRRAGLEDPNTPGRPRIHDLRHTLAVRTLLDWYAAGVDVQARLPWLSTYLGHVEPSSTYWYLWAAPELMAMAA